MHVADRCRRCGFWDEGGRDERWMEGKKAKKSNFLVWCPLALHMIQDISRSASGPPLVSCGKIEILRPTSLTGVS